MLDLGLTTNEVIVFDRDQCVLTDKSKLRDSIVIQSPISGRPDMNSQFEAKETFGNSLRAKIAARGGFASPNSGVLSPQSRTSRQDFDETKSMRSTARSLSIAQSQRPQE